MDADSRGRLAAALLALAPGGVRTGVRRIDERDESVLFPEEQAAVRRAVARRRREFASGRVLLRELVERDIVIPVGASRAPVLPVDVRGSLAHDDEYVVAAVSRDAAVRALGIDIERSVALEPDVADVIRHPDDDDIDAGLALTIKEATYKAWSMFGGRMLEHHDVRVRISGSVFRASVTGEERTFTGGYASAAGRWLALVVDRRS